MSTYWMPLQTGEFLAETTHLTHVEIAAYTLLLIHYWHKTGLPADDRQLARIARLSLKQWKAARHNVGLLFADNWRHPRLDHELAKRALISAKRKVAGAKGNLSQHITNSSKFVTPLAKREIPRLSANALKSLQPQTANAVAFADATAVASATPITITIENKKKATAGKPPNLSLAQIFDL